MPSFLCQTCGTQFPTRATPPAACAICQDERQYVRAGGQQWTTLDVLRADHHNHFQLEEPRLTGIVTEPEFAIGQRALLIQSPAGNVLWDCVSLMDDATIEQVRGLGGLVAIAISHPHFYSSLGDWSRAFGDVPVYLHADNAPYVMNPDPAIVLWEGETCALHDGLTLIRCGGHFAGSQVLHWPAGAAGRGALLTGDTITVVPDRRYVSFMYSYPNLLPLPERRVRQIVAAVEPYAFDRLYGGWFGSVVAADAKQAVQRSAARYLQALRDDFPLKPFEA